MKWYTVNTNHRDRSLPQGFHMTTEATCPVCGIPSVYAHTDSHYSVGKWYGCEHLKASNTNDNGLIESVEYHV
jgi:hypothetical protein